MDNNETTETVNDDATSEDSGLENSGTPVAEPGAAAAVAGKEGGPTTSGPGSDDPSVTDNATSVNPANVDPALAEPQTTRPVQGASEIETSGEATIQTGPADRQVEGEDGEERQYANAFTAAESVVDDKVRILESEGTDYKRASATELYHD